MKKRAIPGEIPRAEHAERLGTVRERNQILELLTQSAPTPEAVLEEVERRVLDFWTGLLHTLGVDPARVLAQAAFASAFQSRPERRGRPQMEAPESLKSWIKRVEASLEGMTPAEQRRTVRQLAETVEGVVLDCPEDRRRSLVIDSVNPFFRAVCRWLALQRCRETSGYSDPEVHIRLRVAGLEARLTPKAIEMDVGRHASFLRRG